MSKRNRTLAFRIALWIAKSLRWGDWMPRAARQKVARALRIRVYGKGYILAKVGLGRLRWERDRESALPHPIQPLCSCRTATSHAQS